MTGQEPPPQYPVGAIVNGHVWTGTEWLPVQVMPQPTAPRQFDEPMSAKFDRLPAWVRVVILTGAMAVVFAVYIYFEPIIEALSGR